MYQDYKDLLSAFRSHGVKYLVVGGFAVIYHSQPRFTKDMDLFIKADPENAKAAYAALAEFGAPLQGITWQDFTDRNSFFRFGREPSGFDILPAIPGVDFDAAWERRVEAVVDTATGLNANVISADDLIASKLASGRARDLADVEDIRKAADSQRPDAKKKLPEPSGPNR
ncbi:MAG: nucleotidyl transferase AbiEii/AbiGii toxin family protein [Bryobacteraceae bacterium]|jgi:hypothetical protein